VNVALTDIGGQKFRFSSAEAFGNPAQVTDGFQMNVETDTAAGGNGQDTLHGAPEDATFDLTLDALKAPVLQGGTGYLTYPGGDWTYYYSRELLHASGFVTVNGQSLAVSGEAWFDHQWGDLGNVVSAGWEWFSLQLDDGRDLMLNWPLVDGGVGAPGGTISSAGCIDTVIGPNDVTLTQLGSWKSPTTGCTYPMGWQIDYLGLSLTITPDLDDQELSGTAGPTYWEGSSTISGDATGKAYVELNGFCP
jgi:predicted secreted hydrolase